MSKTYKMKWKEKDKKELQKLVNNFNAKVKYWKDKGNVTPHRLKVKDLKKNIYSRKDYNQLIKSYSKYLNRNEGLKTVETKSGKVVTKFEYNLNKRLWKKREKWKAERLEKLMNEEVVIDGKKMGYTYSHPYAPQDYIEELRPQEFVLDVEENNVTEKRWESFSKSVERFITNNYDLLTDDEYKQNYIKAMEKENIPDEIIKAVEKINASELVTLLRDNYLQTEIYYVYDKFNHSIVVEKLKSFWVEGNRNEKK